jgi:opacity protein-like surface antigen
MLGFEGDFGRVNRGANSLVLKSNVTTLMGNVVVAVPLSVSGYGLRPFASAGSGLMRATTRDLADVVSFHRNLFALNVGGGVIGPLSDKRAVRFDVRYFRNIRTVGEGGLIENRPSLSFWCASAGFMFKF